MQTLTLSIHDLAAYRAERRLFHSVNLRVSSGEVLQVLGPNGAGKSTLLKLLAGLRSSDSGAIHLNDQAIHHDLAHYQAQLAYLGHRLGLKLNLTVLENLIALPVTDSDKMFVLKQFGLNNHLSALVSQLSQGQKQRLALARICLADKKIWILDEPFSALDQIGFEFFQTKIQAYLQSGGVIILSSHRSLDFKDGVQSLYLEKNDD